MVHKLPVVLMVKVAHVTVKRVHSTKVVRVLLLELDGVAPVAVVVGTVVVVVVD